MQVMGVTKMASAAKEARQLLMEMRSCNGGDLCVMLLTAAKIRPRLRELLTKLPEGELRKAVANELGDVG